MYSIRDVLARLKKHRGTVVYAGGAYDLLHIGHVRYLEQAKKFGDVLVVGIGSNKLVRVRKGKARPVISEKQRAEVVESLKSVDYVFITNKVHYDLSLITQIKPSVLVLPAEKSALPELKKFALTIKVKFPLLKVVFLHSGVRSIVSTSKIVRKVVKNKN